MVCKTVLFKSLKNCKRRNKGNFTLKSNSNKIKLFGGGKQPYCFKCDFNIIISFFKSLYNFPSELNNIFHMKGLIRFTFYVKLIDDMRKT